MASNCFIIMPISTPADLLDNYGDEDHFEHVLDYLFVPAVKKAGLTPIRPLAEGADLIHARIVEQLENSDLVLCDMSSLNPNVFFELGIRTALDKPISLVKDDATPRVPFDTGIINYHEYSSDLSPWLLSEQVEVLANHLMKSTRESDPHNSLWKYFGITSRVHSLSEGATSEDRIALLTSQVEALRRELPSPNVSLVRELAQIDDPEIGDEIRRARKKMGISLTELAQRAGVSKATVSRIENDTIRPTKLSLQAILRVLDLKQNE